MDPPNPIQGLTPCHTKASDSNHITGPGSMFDRGIAAGPNSFGPNDGYSTDDLADDSADGLYTTDTKLTTWLCVAYDRMDPQEGLGLEDTGSGYYARDDGDQ